MFKLTIATLAVVLTLCSTAEAKRGSHRNHAEAKILSHPEGCPRRAFCGCGTCLKVGLSLQQCKQRGLYLAREWFKYPKAKPAPGMVAVRNHHVFYIEKVLGPGRVLAYDPNSGGHLTRLHERKLAGYSVRNPGGRSMPSVAEPQQDRHTVAKLNVDGENGIASTFYDKRTACAPFRMNPYKVAGIAHKTLPCGTAVQVTNLRNNRTALVRVVDRGPCTSNYCQTRMPKHVRARKFDLTAKLARNLGSNGLAMVSVRVVDRTALR